MEADEHGRIAATGIPIEMRQVGQGPDLVLLHSLLADARAFEPVLPALAKRFRVTIPSLPGYGGTPGSKLAIQDLGRELVEALQLAGVVRFHLLGNGYGGFVALSIAQQWPDRVDRLILLDTAAYFPPAGREGVAAMKQSVEAGGMQAVADAAMKRLFPDPFRSANGSLIEECRQALLGFAPVQFAQTCQNLIEVDLRGDLVRVVAPTLVVVGEEDAATPPALSRELAERIPNAHLVVLPGCGHAPHLQAPHRVLEILDGFLDH